MTAVEAEKQSSTSTTERLRARWQGMAGKLGMGFALLGFLLILFAWNGAAGKDYTQGQIPYLISGGVSGLGLIILGAALLITESQRRDRALLEQRLEELSAAITRMTSPQGNGAQATDSDSDSQPRRRATAKRSSPRSRGRSRATG